MKRMLTKLATEKRFSMLLYGIAWLLLLVMFPRWAYAGSQIAEIDFHRGDAGQGVLTVELDKAQSLIDIRQSGLELFVEVVDATISDEMLYVLDVNDFATTVKSVETFRSEKGVKLLLKMSERFDYDYTTKGNQIDIVVSAKPKSEKNAENSISYKGKPISINFQDVPVRNVLQLIADYNDFNLVVSDTVEGNVTLRLDDVPWPQVLDIILQSKGLDKRINGKVVLVAPKAELDHQEQQALAAQRKAEELAALRSELIQVNYAKAIDLAELLSGAEDGVTMLSSRGSLHVDERTNSLIIKDLPDSIENIKDILSALDIPVKQVQIEARIVTMTEGDLEELGVRWGVISNNGDTTIGGSIESNLHNRGLLDKKSTVGDYLNVNLGATAPGASSIAFQVAKMGDILLDLELSALQSEEKAEIISSPRLMTTNKKTAYIEQGTELPYLEASSSGAVSVKFKKAVLSLMVTPQITPDNKLVLDLVVTQDKPGKTVKTGTGEAVAIDTQRIGTQVLVENGETLVLGGIYQHEMAKKIEQVPLLGDLPLLGALFRRTKEDLGKKELLIFVTPKIVFQ